VANRHVVFSHGSESSPRSTKITALAETARTEGFSVEAVDYQGVDDAKERVSMLCDACKDLQGDIVLVGSSLGGYVSLAAAALLHAKAVFLMAPAIYTPGLPPLRDGSIDCPVGIVHGWNDTVVPVEHSIRFAREHAAMLHIINSDHRMHDQLPLIRHLFEYFIISIDLGEQCWHAC
jgi:pimeloyl-ACP methyl ester carboxylesterase